MANCLGGIIVGTVERAPIQYWHWSLSAGSYPGQGVSIVAKDDWKAVTGGNIFNWCSVSGNVRMGLQCRDGRRTLYWAIWSLSDTSYLQFGLHKKRKKYIGDVNKTLITLNWRKSKFFIATLVHIRRQSYVWTATFIKSSTERTGIFSKIFWIWKITGK